MTWMHKLKNIGLLGINKRNADYILPENARKYYPLVDDKYLTKKLAQSAGVPVPSLIGVIQIQRQVRSLPTMLGTNASFVVKPARGSGGEGIIVFTGRVKNLYRRSNGYLMSQEDLTYHLSRVLSGVFSLGGHPDKVLIEERIEFAPVFDQVSYSGIPDIRVIVSHGVPVMAMVRLPTRMSDGKANLHQGAVGAGIDLGTGTTINAVWRNSLVTEHPDTGVTVLGLEIPQWKDFLLMASKCFELAPLGYLGVDMVYDTHKGPTLLELNARPGLSIQIANGTGLESRLARVKLSKEELHSAEERVDFAMREFAVRNLNRPCS
jgi:alpha-L-glutamate ligase-like protein